MAHGQLDGAGRRAWLSAALLSAALLILPALTWLLLPGPSPIAVPPRSPAIQVEAPRPAAPEPPEPAQPAMHRPEEPAAPAEAPASSGPVRGVVLDPTGKPIAGAFVSCKDRPAVGGGTDGEGRFEISEEADGCTAVATQAVYSPSEPTRLAAGQDNVLRLLPSGAIEGVVVSEQGKPVEAYLLAVESYLPSGEDPSGDRGATPATSFRAGTTGHPRVVEDPGGAFRMDGLAPGRYVLTASSAGRPPARSDSIDVEAGRTTRNVRIVLSLGAKLSGRVTSADTRAPIVEAQIELDSVTSSGANAISLVLSDASGNYELDGVPATGPFSIKVRHPEYVTKIVPGLDARSAPTLHADIELRARGDGGASEELAGVGASLAPSSRGVMILGVVDGSPAARAGLERGDRIVRIDGVDARALPLSDCVQRLRGPEGTRVTVGVDRDGQTIEVAMVREVVVR